MNWEIMHNFDKDIGVAKLSDKHIHCTHRSDQDDFKKAR